MFFFIFFFKFLEDEEEEPGAAANCCSDAAGEHNSLLLVVYMCGMVHCNIERMDIIARKFAGSLFLGAREGKSLIMIFYPTWSSIGVSFGSTITKSSRSTPHQISCC